MIGVLTSFLPKIKPPSWLIELLAFVLCLGALWWTGYRVGGESQRADDAELAVKQTAAEVKARVFEQKRREQVGIAAEQANAQVQTQIETRTRVLRQEVIRYVQTQPGIASCSLDADGMRIWRDANAGRDTGTDAARQPHAGMPRSSAAGQSANSGPPG
jgi:hypothetical protein